MSLFQLWLTAIGLVVVGAIVLIWGRGRTIVRGKNTTHRERHLALVVIGGTCVGLGGVFMIIEGWDHFTVNPPNWWIERGTYAEDTADRRRSIRMMVRRIYEGELSQEKVADAVDRAIKIQANVNETWEPAWGELVLSARETKAISEDVWQRYVQNALNCTPALEARPLVRRGAPIPVLVHGLPTRPNGPMYSAGVRLTYRLHEVEIDGKTVILPAESSIDVGSIQQMGNAPQPFLIQLPSTLEKTLPSGEHALRLVFDRLAHEETRSPLWGRLLDQQRFDVTTSWQLTDAATVTVVEDERLIDEVRSNLSVMSYPRQGMMEGMMVLRVQAGQLPVNVACDVVARAGTREKPLPSFALSKPQSRSPRLMLEYSLSGQPLQLVLRPSIPAAERTVDLTRIWGGEVVLDVDP